MYIALIGSLALLAYGTGDAMIAIGVAGAGIFTAGVQLVVYGLAPNYYEPLIRGTGVGWLVAIGRCGSVAGPLSAGFLLAAGIGTNDVLVIAIPGLVLALIAVLIVLARAATNNLEAENLSKFRAQLPTPLWGGLGWGPIACRFAATPTRTWLAQFRPPDKGK